MYSYRFSSFCLVQLSRLLWVFYQVFICLRTQPELFDGKDQDRIFELIYAADRSLAVIAGEIVLSRMRSLAETDRKHGRRFKSGNEWTDDVWDVYEIVRFYVESPAVHSHCAYLVDSLIDICPTIR